MPSKTAKPSSSSATERGRDAVSPWRIPLAGWKEIAGRTWRQTWIDNVGLVAAGVAFYGFLAFIPLLHQYGPTIAPQSTGSIQTAAAVPWS